MYGTHMSASAPSTLKGTLFLLKFSTFDCFCFSFAQFLRPLFSILCILSPFSVSQQVCEHVFEISYHENDV